MQPPFIQFPWPEEASKLTIGLNFSSHIGRNGNLPVGGKMSALAKTSGCNLNKDFPNRMSLHNHDCLSSSHNFYNEECRKYKPCITGYLVDLLDNSRQGNHKLVWVAHTLGMFQCQERDHPHHQQRDTTGQLGKTVAYGQLAVGCYSHLKVTSTLQSVGSLHRTVHQFWDTLSQDFLCTYKPLSSTEAHQCWALCIQLC